MSDDPVAGKKIRWTYDDGPVKGKTFEHSFTNDGKVSYSEPGVFASEPSIAYQVARIDDAVYVVSYLATSGWTLTTVVDEKSRKIVSFASNEKQLVTQHGRLV